MQHINPKMKNGMAEETLRILNHFDVNDHEKNNKTDFLLQANHKTIFKKM
jgi:hypothetical protein